ncbi:TetR family transcriptional regulator [Piscinibacter sakaiensis]
MAQALEQRRYAELTIADVVAAAAVSRRTFYEHWAPWRPTRRSPARCWSR